MFMRLGGALAWQDGSASVVMRAARGCAAAMCLVVDTCGHEYPDAGQRAEGHPWVMTGIAPQRSGWRLAAGVRALPKNLSNGSRIELCAMAVYLG